MTCHRLGRNGIGCVDAFAVVASLFSSRWAVRLAAPGVCQLLVVVVCVILSWKSSLVNTTWYLCIVLCGRGDIGLSVSSSCHRAIHHASNTWSSSCMRLSALPRMSLS